MKDFFVDEVPKALEKLKAETKPEWGSMTAQHMIEHLVGSWRISNGRAQVQLMTPKERLPAYRQFLFSDEPYKKNLMNPIFANGLPPLRKESLDAAVQQLIDEMWMFFEYFNEHPEATFIHPVFGELDKEGWLTFQRKHMGHHLTQFGVL